MIDNMNRRVRGENVEYVATMVILEAPHLATNKGWNNVEVENNASNVIIPILGKGTYLRAISTMRHIIYVANNIMSVTWRTISMNECSHYMSFTVRTSPVFTHPKIWMGLHLNV